MTETDMILWSVIKGDGRSVDMYSFGQGVPKIDKVQDVRNESSPTFNLASKTFTFVTRRKLDTGDAKSDYLVLLDAENAMSVAF